MVSFPLERFVELGFMEQDLRPEKQLETIPYNHPRVRRTHLIWSRRGEDQQDSAEFSR